MTGCAERNQILDPIVVLVSVDVMHCQIRTFGIDRMSRAFLALLLSANNTSVIVAFQNQRL